MVLELELTVVVVFDLLFRRPIYYWLKSVTVMMTKDWSLNNNAEPQCYLVTDIENCLMLRDSLYNLTDNYALRKALLSSMNL